MDAPKIRMLNMLEIENPSEWAACLRLLLFLCAARWVQTALTAVQPSRHEDNCDILPSSSPFEVSAGWFCVGLKWEKVGDCFEGGKNTVQNPSLHSKWTLLVNTVNVASTWRHRVFLLMRRVSPEDTRLLLPLALCAPVSIIVFIHIKLIAN